MCLAIPSGAARRERAWRRGLAAMELRLSGRRIIQSRAPSSCSTRAYPTRQEPNRPRMHATGQATESRTIERWKRESGGYGHRERMPRSRFLTDCPTGSGLAREASQRAGLTMQSGSGKRIWRINQQTDNTDTLVRICIGVFYVVIYRQQHNKQRERRLSYEKSYGYDKRFAGG